MGYVKIFIPFTHTNELELDIASEAIQIA